MSRQFLCRFFAVAVVVQPPSAVLRCHFVLCPGEKARRRAKRLRNIKEQPRAAVPQQQRNGNSGWHLGSLGLTPGITPKLAKRPQNLPKWQVFFARENGPRKGRRPNLILTRCLPKSLADGRFGMAVAYYFSDVGVFFCASRAGLIEARGRSLTCEYEQ